MNLPCIMRHLSATLREGASIASDWARGPSWCTIVLARQMQHQIVANTPSPVNIPASDLYRDQKRLCDRYTKSRECLEACDDHRWWTAGLVTIRHGPAHSVVAVAKSVYKIVFSYELVIRTRFLEVVSDSSSDTRVWMHRTQVQPLSLFTSQTRSAWTCQNRAHALGFVSGPAAVKQCGRYTSTLEHYRQRRLCSTLKPITAADRTGMDCHATLCTRRYAWSSTRQNRRVQAIRSEFQLDKLYLLPGNGRHPITQDTPTFHDPVCLKIRGDISQLVIGVRDVASELIRAGIFYKLCQHVSVDDEKAS